MKIEEIKDLMESFQRSGCSTIEVQQADFSLKIEKKISMEIPAAEPVFTVENTAKVEATAAPAKEAVAPRSDLRENENGEVVKAPIVGIFYAAANPESEPYVEVGSRVEEGQVLCLIEAMKMMSEITATKAGVIKEIYVKNQDVVGFEDPLFLIGD